jgi:hypothetical protein
MRAGVGNDVNAAIVPHRPARVNRWFSVIRYWLLANALPSNQ